MHKLVATTFIGIMLSSQYFLADQAKADDFDNTQTQLPTIYYAEKKQNDTYLMQKKGHSEANTLATFPGNPSSYKMSPDGSNLFLNYGNEIKNYNLETKETKNIYKPLYQITNLIYSPDGKNIVFVDQSKKLYNNYRIHNYNYVDDRDEVIFQGRGLNALYPYAWRQDNIIVFIGIRGNNETLFYFDLNTKKFKQTGYKNPYWLSPDGRYVAMPNQHFGDDYFSSAYNHNVYDRNNNENYNYSDYYNGTYSMMDPVSGQDYGNIGYPQYRNKIIGYHPDNNNIMYQSYDYQKKVPYYFGQTIGQGQNYKIDSPHDEFSKWQSGNTDIKIYGNVYIIYAANQELYRSNNPVDLIYSHYDNDGDNPDYYYNKDRGKDENYNDNENYNSNYTNMSSVSVRNFSFNPSTITINRGTTVVWKNDDNHDHTVTAFDKTFDSGTIAPGGTYQYTFEEKGGFSYYCTLHPEMRGKVYIK
ncbi:MAG: cupredoxin family copper-binding protein [Patescibacteria group bacterium]